MFEAEKAGLEALQKPKVIDVPNILGIGKIENTFFTKLLNICKLMLQNFQGRTIKSNA